VGSPLPAERILFFPPLPKGCLHFRSCRRRLAGTVFSPPPMLKGARRKDEGGRVVSILLLPKFAFSLQ